MLTNKPDCSDGWLRLAKDRRRTLSILNELLVPVQMFQIHIEQLETARWDFCC